MTLKLMMHFFIAVTYCALIINHNELHTVLLYKYYPVINVLFR